MAAVVRGEHLVKKYEDVVAVNDISFEINEGECFGFLGPNGAGKTTAMRMIHCVTPLTKGDLTVLGMDVTKEPRKIKALIGVAPQEDNLDPDFSVVQNLTVYARYFRIGKGVAEKRAKDLLRFMQLEEKTGTQIDKLSGGMKRRLIIARALINDPRILILDEPTTGLDPQARHLIWERVRELKKKGVTVIITTHYMDEAEQLCDRLVIMDHGKIVKEGTPQALIREVVGQCVMEILNPQEELIRDYVREEGWNSEETADRIYVYSNNCQLAQKKFADRFPETFSTIRTATLEDVFLKLTGRGLRD